MSKFMIGMGVGVGLLVLSGCAFPPFVRQEPASGHTITRMGCNPELGAAHAKWECKLSWPLDKGEVVEQEPVLEKRKK